jgi:DNA-binding transcriptional regulator YiaG
MIEHKELSSKPYAENLPSKWRVCNPHAIETPLGAAALVINPYGRLAAINGTHIFLIDEVRARELSDFSARLFNARTTVGLSQAELAELLHTYKNTVYRWENGKRLPNEERQREIIDIIETLDVVAHDKGKEPYLKNVRFSSEAPSLSAAVVTSSLKPNRNHLTRRNDNEN